MSLLTAATLIYAGVLVLALVAILATVAVQLWLVSRALAEIRAALTAVGERTSPLRDHLSGLSALREENVGRIEDATRDIEAAVERLLEAANAAAS